MSLEPPNWYFASKLIHDEASPIWMLVVAEWVVRMDMYLIREVHDIYRL